MSTRKPPARQGAGKCRGASTRAGGRNRQGRQNLRLKNLQKNFLRSVPDWYLLAAKPKENCTARDARLTLAPAFRRPNWAGFSGGREMFSNRIKQHSRTRKKAPPLKNKVRI